MKLSMKRTLTLVSLTLLTGSLLACSSARDENDSDVHGQSAAREAVGITESDSTQDKVVHNTQIDRGAEVDLNDQIYIDSNTTPIGNEKNNQTIVTDRYGTQVNQNGQMAGQGGLTQTGKPSLSAQKQLGTSKLDGLNAPELSTLRELVQTAELEGTLTQGEHTLLAPSNQAFSQLPQSKLEQLRSDKAQLRQVLLYHVIQKPMSAQTLAGVKDAPTLLGDKKLTMAKDATGRMHISQAHILRKDLRSGQGYVHVIDKVLIPASLPQN